MSNSDPITLVYYNKEDADFLSHTCTLFTDDFNLTEIYKGEMPNGKSKSVMHFYSDQITALTAYKIFSELDMTACLGAVLMQWDDNGTLEWVVVVDDPKKHSEFLSSCRLVKPELVPVR